MLWPRIVAGLGPSGRSRFIRGPHLVELFDEINQVGEMIALGAKPSSITVCGDPNACLAAIDAYDGVRALNLTLLKAAESCKNKLVSLTVDMIDMPGLVDLDALCRLITNIPNGCFVNMMSPCVEEESLTAFHDHVMAQLYVIYDSVRDRSGDGGYFMPDVEETFAWYDATVPESQGAHAIAVQHARVLAAYLEWRVHDMAFDRRGSDPRSYVSLFPILYTEPRRDIPLRLVLPGVMMRSQPGEPRIQYNARVTHASRATSKMVIVPPDDLAPRLVLAPDVINANLSLADLARIYELEIDEEIALAARKNMP
jgi:hypothetical protein